MEQHCKEATTTSLKTFFLVFYSSKWAKVRPVFSSRSSSFEKSLFLRLSFCEPCALSSAFLACWPMNAKGFGQHSTSSQVTTWRMGLMVWHEQGIRGFFFYSSATHSENLETTYSEGMYALNTDPIIPRACSSWSLGEYLIVHEHCSVWWRKWLLFE